MVRRILTKPVWWWERNRSYPVRECHRTLPPLPVERGHRHFVILVTPNALNDALWAAWSWYRHLRPEDFDLQIAVDGKLRESEIAIVQKLFPGILVYDVNPLLIPLCQQWPALDAFLRHYALGRKLGLLLALSQRHSFLFSDHDVLAFNPPAEMLSYVERDLPCYIQEEREGNYDPAIIARSSQLGLECLDRFNSGLLNIPLNSLSIDVAAQLLSTWRPPGLTWFAEQTTLSVLMRLCNARALPSDRYVVSGRRQFYWQKDVDYDRIVARHFTGTVRHVMYGSGIPLILRQSRLSTP